MLNRESSSKTDLKIPDLHGRVDWECSMVAKLEKSRKKFKLYILDCKMHSFSVNCATQGEQLQNFYQIPWESFLLEPIGQ